MNDLRTKLIRLAHAKPELRAQLLPLIKEAAYQRPHNPFDWSDEDIREYFDSNPDLRMNQLARMTGRSMNELKRILMPGKYASIGKVAHKPHIREINRNTNRAGLSSMLYSINAGENKSKFHEMHVDGTTLKRVWGALTDRGGFGRTQDKSESFSSPEQAMRQMQKIKASKIKGPSKYIDAYGPLHKTPDGKKLPQGQYPIGLTRDVGFGWGTQESAFCIPELMRLQEDLAKHQSILSRTLPSSDMGKKILGQIKTLTRYLEKQMALCN